MWLHRAVITDEARQQMVLTCATARVTNAGMDNKIHAACFTPTRSKETSFKADCTPVRVDSLLEESRERTSRLLLVLAVLVSSLAGEVTAGQITGRVRLEGKPPPEKIVDFTDYPDVAKAYPHLVGKLTTRHYVVGEDGGLANVFIYIKDGLAGRAFPPMTNAVVLDQTNAVFNPYVLGICTQQTLIVRNSEPYLDAPQCECTNNKPFNFAQPITGMINRHRFEKPEVLIRVKCGIHPWEFAFIGVVEHPFFAVSGTDGRYSLPAGLPPGKYVVEAVHPKAGRLTREVTLSADQTVTVDFTFTVPTQKK